jgi:pimeloyl-ACP methyl ester carboxylesterase
MEMVRSADGVTIAVEHSGQGPALILVSGAFCDRASSRSLAASLRPQFTVYAFDRRGRGDSGDADSYGISREVADLATVALAAGGAPFVYGHSSGASLALEAVARGVPMRGLAVYEPPYGAGATAEFADELAASGRESEAASRFLLATGTPAEMLRQMQAVPYWAQMSAFAATLPYDVRLASAGIPADGLSGISVPVLAVAGGASPDWARDAATAISAAVPGARSLVLPGQTHGVAQDALVPVLTEFFLGA